MAKRKTLLTIPEAAQELDLAVRTIQDYLQHGHLEAVVRPDRGRRTRRYVTMTSIRNFRREVARRAS